MRSRRNFALIAVFAGIVLSGVFLAVSASCACVQRHSPLGQVFVDECRSGQYNASACALIGYSAVYEDMKNPDARSSLRESGDGGVPVQEPETGGP